MARTLFGDIVYSELSRLVEHDDYYTRMCDIEKELPNYSFAGKAVYCNCDNPNRSEFCRYFSENYVSLKLSGLYASTTMDDKGFYFFDGKEWNFHIKNDGRFQTNSDRVSQCDIIVTNPPFSERQAADVVDLALRNGKDFIIVGPLMLLRDGRMSEYYKRGMLNPGFTWIGRFIGDDDLTHKAKTMWWTSIRHPMDRLETGVSFNDVEYETYRNVDAIECPSYEMIPDDYYGLMGAPCSFVQKMDREQFEFVGLKDCVLPDGTKKARILISRK